MKPTLKTTQWDRVVAAAATNKDAALARDGKGVGFNVPESALVNALDAPPKLRRYEDIPANDLTGQRFQKLVVLGLVDRKRGNGDNGGAAWACRCDCSRYAVFTAQGLRKQRAVGRAMCSECDYVEELKAGRLPSEEEREAQREAKASLRERQAAVRIIVHPKLAELKATLASIGIDDVEFAYALGDYARSERERINAEKQSCQD